ncbi:uncharacterized protein Dwil_GK11395 [Drosophila willistoni]|uniref:Uncharacterized protein n=1 Tax=Drosophila willistoni TaxID=7260 RepID=B4N428_DROWI|nr:transcription factor Ken [Drosophila willistoni]EDW78902.1 uncharacterized protein Dwil_GK11395 [Drosophila willistoni]
MVAYYDDCDATLNPKTLTDWVRNFRLKRVQMRRKLRGAGSDLRVNAILSTALLQAELELRRKQQERFNRWLDMQTKFVPHGKTHCGSDAAESISNRMESEPEAAAECERREIESDLWRSELSGLDSFMRSLSGNSSNNNSTNNNNQHHHHAPHHHIHNGSNSNNGTSSNAITVNS